MWIEIVVMEKNTAQSRVTSLAEVWIEIITIGRTFVPALVTSLAEVWIEMTLSIGKPVAILSLPLRKCGLKYL